MTVLFRVADLETTGLVAPEAEVIELGITDLTFDPDTKAVHIGEPRSLLFRPERGIPPETSAIHHLLMRDVEGRPVCTPEALMEALAGADFIACHNLAFDGQWLTPGVIAPARGICTLKAASRVWPEAPGHANGVLRYWLGLDLDPAFAMPPHRAGPDSYVTAHILAKFLETERASHMVAWSLLPRWMPTCPLKKHKGLPWSAVPFDYLEWIVFKATDMDPDTKHWAREELEERARSR